MSDAPDADPQRPPFGLTPEEADRLQEITQQLPLHALLDLRPVRLDAEGVVFEMPVAENAFNPTGNLHGGAIATLIDVCAGTAAALGSHTFDPTTNTLVTADMHIRYLGRPKGDVVRGHAWVVRSGRQLVITECDVRDEHERLIARADFAAMVVPLRDPLKPTSWVTGNEPDL